MKLSIFKKIRYFYLYKKTIKIHEDDMKKKFNLEIDRLQRIWTVLSFSKEDVNNINKYGHTFIDNEVSKFVKEVDLYFRKINITEFIKIENIEILNPLEVGVVFSFKFFNPKKIFWSKLILFLTLITSISLLIFI